MKKFKNFFIAILLLSVLSISIVLCACTPNDSKDNQPSGAISGNINKTEQPSGEASGNIKEDEKLQGNIIEIDQSVKVKIYKDNNLYKKDNAQTSFLINSIEELNDLCDEETSLYFKKNHLTMQDVYPPEFLTEDKLKDENFIKAFDELFNNRNKKMISILKQYDEEFFQDNSIVVLFRFRSSTGYFYRFDGYQIDGNELSVDLVRKLPTEPVEYPAAITNCVYIMEINKEKVANVTQINVNEYVE